MAIRGEIRAAGDATGPTSTHEVLPGALDSAPADTIRLLMTITRCWPAVGGAEIHTRELLRAFGPRVAPVVAAHWSANRTDWLLGTTVRAPSQAHQFDDEGRPVHLIAPSVGDRLRG